MAYLPAKCTRSIPVHLDYPIPSRPKPLSNILWIWTIDLDPMRQARRKSKIPRKSDNHQRVELARHHKVFRPGITGPIGQTQRDTRQARYIERFCEIFSYPTELITWLAESQQVIVNQVRPILKIKASRKNIRIQMNIFLFCFFPPLHHFKQSS